MISRLTRDYLQQSYLLFANSPTPFWQKHIIISWTKAGIRGGTARRRSIDSKIPACPCEKPAGPPTMGIQHLLAFYWVQSISLLISVATVGTVVAPASSSSLREWGCQLVLSARGDDARSSTKARTVAMQWNDNGFISSLSHNSHLVISTNKPDTELLHHKGLIPGATSLIPRYPLLQSKKSFELPDHIIKN